jgi:DNA-directed RNA polymerase specialized sigma24 family protein
MADSFAAAFGEVEGPEFDLIVGYSIPPRKHAPTDEAIRAAFKKFDYRHVHKIARRLSSRYRCHPTHAEDAAQEGLIDLFVKRPDLFRENPENWLGLLYAVAKFRLLDIKSRQRRTASIEELTERAGDVCLAGARLCVPPSLDAEEESKYAPPPGAGEEWNPTQIIGAFQRFRDYYGRPPKAKECKSVDGLPSCATIYRCFGNFADAVLAAGMIPDTLGQRRKPWRAIEAARACRAFRRRNGYWPGWAEINRNPGELPGARVMVRFFGGTRAAEVQLGAEAILFGTEAAAV